MSQLLSKLTSFSSIFTPNSNEAGNDHTSTIPTNDAARSSASTRTSTSRTQATDTSSCHQPSGSLKGPRKRSPSVEILVEPRKRSHPAHTISADEKRLCGDYTRPADAISVPNPIIWADGRHSSFMMKHKPGSGQAPKPVNTIDHGNAYQPTHKPATATYGSKSRTPKLQGQMEYEENFLNNQSDTPRSRISPRSHARQERSSPHKRRKLEHSSPARHNVIDLAHAEDDDFQMLTTRPQTVAHRPEIPPSVSSRSRGSVEGDCRRRSRKLEQPHSNFNEVNEALNSRRSKPRRTGSVTAPRSPSGHRNRYLIASSPSAAALNEEDMNILQQEDADEPNDGITYKYQQSGYLVPEQDVDMEMDELQVTHQTTRSHHLPPTPSRMNPSTSNRHSVNVTNRRTGNLRNQFIRGIGINPVEEIDELADDSIGSRKGQLDKTSTRAVQSFNTGSRKGREKANSGWPLLSARSHNIDHHGPDLFLRRKMQAKEFGILTSEGDLPTESSVVNLGKVTRCFTDEVSKIRLSGPSTNGRQYGYDLEFADADDLKVFCEHHVQPNVMPGRFFVKDILHMQRAFAIPPYKEKLSPIVTDPEMEILKDMSETRAKKEGTGDSQSSRPKRNLLINQMAQAGLTMVPNQAPRELYSTGSIDQTSGIANRGSRPVRSTRATKGVYDLESDLDAMSTSKETSKFSVEKGLGPKWTKPLQYGTGRHRAIVDFDDLPRLDEDEMLNDALVDFYLIYLFDQAQIKSNTVYFFNSHFFTTLTRPVPNRKGEINYTGVHKWAKEDIFTYDHIVVPVCENFHWYLAIICNTPNISRKPVLTAIGSSSPIPQSASMAAEEDSGARNATSSNRPQSSGILPGSERKAEGQTTASDDADDLNLFDEERKESQPVTSTEQSLDEQLMAAATGNNARESSLEETGRLQRLSIDDSPSRRDERSQGILGNASALPTGSSKKKAKRKSFPLKKYPADQPIILILDSLGGSHPRTGRALKDYIAEEGLNKRGIDARIEQNVFYVRESHIPMQQNFTDCGVYLLGYLQKFFADPHKFVRQILSREMDAEADWPEMSAGKIRDAMRKILLDQGQQQGLTRTKKEKKAKQNISSSVQKEHVSQQAEAKPLSLPHSQIGIPESFAPGTEGPKPPRDRNITSTTPPAKRGPDVFTPADEPTSYAAETRRDISPKKEGVTFTHQATNHIKRNFKEGSQEISPPGAAQTNHLSPRRSPSVGHGSSLAYPGLHDPARKTKSVDRSSVARSNVPLRGSSVDPISIEDSQDTVQERSPTPTNTTPTNTKKAKIQLSPSMRGSTEKGTRLQQTKQEGSGSKTSVDRLSPGKPQIGDHHPADGLLERLGEAPPASVPNKGQVLIGQDFDIYEDAEVGQSSMNGTVNLNFRTTSVAPGEDDDKGSIVIEETPEPEI